MRTFWNLLFGVSAALLCGLAGCEKSNKETPVDVNLLKYFSYKPGTYWVMRDSISGRVDSFFVTANKFYSTFNGSQQNDIGIEISEYTNGHVNTDSTFWGIDLTENLFLLNLSSPRFWYVTSGAPLFSYPFIASSTLNILPSYSLNGNDYSNVAAIIFYAGNLIDEDWYYVNTAIGFIKIRLYCPQANIHYVWELQRYAIVY